MCTIHTINICSEDVQIRSRKFCIYTVSVLLQKMLHSIRSLHCDLNRYLINDSNIYLCGEPLQKIRVRLGPCKTGLSPQ